VPDLLSVPAEVPLVERGDVLASVGGMLADAHEGRGGVLLVEGPAGIGKTRLVTAAHARADAAGVRGLRARAGELEHDFSYGVVRQLFEAPLAGGERAGMLAGAAALAGPLFEFARVDDTVVADPAYGTLHGLYWLTVNFAEQGPVLISVDDLHWCDPPSLRYLAYLVRRLEGLRVLLLATVRPPADAGSWVIDQLATDPATTPVRLQALSRDGVAAVLAARLGVDPDPTFSSAVHESTAGNPLLVREVAGAALARGIAPTQRGAPEVRELAPEGVARLVLHRIAPLGARSRALAEAIAVLGDGAELIQAAELAGLSHSDAARAAQALQGIDVLRGGERLAFAHPLVRRAIYDRLDASEREHAHARAAELLAARHAAPASVAAHLLAVGPRKDPALVAPLREAARQALAQGAPDAAAVYLSRALAEPPADAERPSVTLELGLADARVNPADGIPHLIDALELVEDDAALAEATTALGVTLHQVARDSEWPTFVDRAMARMSDERCRRRVEADYIWLASYRPDLYPTAKERLARIPPERCGDDAADRLLLAMHASYAAREGRRSEEALELARAALAGGILIAERDTPAYAVPVSVLAHLDRFDEAIAMCGEALAQARRIGSAYLFATASWLRADTWLGRGDLAEAEADSTSAIEAVKSVQTMHGFHAAWYTLGETYVHRGDLAGAASYLENPEQAEEDPGVWESSLIRGRRGILRAAQGRLDEALDDLLIAGSWLEALGVVNPAYLPWRSEAALVLTRLGRREEALGLAHEEVQLARTWGAARALGRALCSAGLVVGNDDGVSLLREAVDVLSDSPALLVRARATTELGAALRRRNRRSEARELLATGLESAERCGASALVERARTELVATGARPRRAVRTGVDALTPSERRVAQLAAGGRTNRDIAQELFVTPKTVEVHLSHTYQKLDIRSRSQLAAALSAHADPS
jgi:DNA-binding CsgD family transcriptional regulator